MKKNYLSFIMLTLSILGYSQVGVNTENPQAFFHIDGAGDNEKKGAATEAHQANDVVVTSEGKVGIGTNSPTNSLHIKAASNPLKLEGLSSGDQAQNSILSIDNTGIVKNMGTISTLGLWDTKGNMGTDATTNFLGTTNVQDLKIRTNNTERMRISANGNVTIGPAATSTSPDDPTILLNVKGKIKATATSDPLTLNGVAVGNVANDKLIAVNADGTVKTLGTIADLGIPTPALFRLDKSILNFLYDSTNLNNIGAEQTVPMTLISNKIPGLTYNTKTSTITFPKGIYQMMFAYEATHNASGCTLSSYFVEFPNQTRIHNTSNHSQGGNSNHGGNIIYSAKISAPVDWTIALGRGQSGNCFGSGMELRPLSTYLLVLRIGAD